MLRIDEQHDGLVVMTCSGRLSKADFESFVPHSKTSPGALARYEC